MDLYEKLLNLVEKREIHNMRAVLFEAKKSGIPREQALSVLRELYNVVDLQGDQEAEDAVVDYLDILNFHCHPNNYIWIPQRNSAGEIVDQE